MAPDYVRRVADSGRVASDFGRRLREEIRSRPCGDILGTVTRKILFASQHTLVDPSNGASRTVRCFLGVLAEAGWRAFSCEGPRHSMRDAHLHMAEMFALEGLRPSLLRFAKGAASGTLRRARYGDVEIANVEPDGYRRSAPLPRAQAEVYLLALDAMIARERPDVVLTYGGDWIGRAILDRAKASGAGVAFALFNHAYGKRDLFTGVDATFTPSDATRSHYVKTLGLIPDVIRDPLDARLLSVPEAGRRYLTYVSPNADKGAGIATRAIAILAALRPDIPVLVVEGRASNRALDRLRETLAGTRVDFMPATRDPRHFLALTRAVLMPSRNEPSGRIAGEAIINGIPVIGSRAGGLPETIGDAGMLLDLPARFANGDDPLATEDEAAPWAEAAIALWDDAARYAALKERCIAARQRLELVGVRPKIVSFFEALADKTQSRREKPLAARSDRNPMLDRGLADGALPTFSEVTIAEATPAPAIVPLA